nr:MAG TPA: hypothetical protein [Caudoviricetes sp.]
MRTLFEQIIAICVFEMAFIKIVMYALITKKNT